MTRPQLEAQLLTNLVLERELRPIHEALFGHGIDYIVLKGPPLARCLYGTLARRHMIDNDVMVRKNDATQAADALFQIGYRPGPFRRLESDLRIDFQFPMTREAGHGQPVTVDLHWNAFPPNLFPVDEELLWRRVENLELAGTTIKVFDKTMTLIHLASHFVQHRLASPRILEDLAAGWNLWHQDIDEEDLLGLARQTGVIHALDFTLGAAAELGILDAPPPLTGSAKAARLRRLLPARQLLEKPAYPSHYRAALALLLVNPRRIPGWLRLEVFPPLDRMAAIYEQPITPRLYLRYLERPFRPLLRGGFQGR